MPLAISRKVGAELVVIHKESGQYFVLKVVGKKKGQVIMAFFDDSQNFLFQRIGPSSMMTPSVAHPITDIISDKGDDGKISEVDGENRD
jgi:hypothetical protein